MFSACPPRSSIYGVTDQGMLKKSHMHPDLVRSPGIEAAFNQRRCFPKALEDGISGSGMFAASFDDRHLLAVAGVAADGTLNHAGLFRNPSPAECDIGAFDAAVLELTGKAFVGFVSFGNHHQAAGLFVNAVDDAGTPNAPDTGK